MQGLENQNIQPQGFPTAQEAQMPVQQPVQQPVDPQVYPNGTQQVYAQQPYVQQPVAQPVYVQQTYVQPPIQAPGYPQPQPQAQYYPPQQYYYAYDTTWVPPPAQDASSGNHYDPTKTEVHYITVDQWNQIENDKSEYSNLWGKDEFTAEKFAANQKANDNCLDKGWLIAFWINFLGSIILMIIIATCRLEQETTDTTTTQIIALAEKISGKEVAQPHVLEELGENIDDSLKKVLIKAILIGVGIGLALTVIHFLYMGFAPRVYIKFGLWIGIIILVIACLIPLFIDITVGIIFLGIAAFFFLVFLCVYCCCLKEYIEFTCMVFEKTTSIEKSHPMIFLVIFIQIIIELAVNIIFALVFFYIFWNNWSYYIYLYYLFSYYWVIVTNYYVFYLISANLAANCYFLEGTEYFPENPLWDSVKRSLTTTFGSAAFAGFIAAVIQILEKIAENLMKSDNKVLQLIGLIAWCILCCIKALFNHVSRYGLFYVTVYNVPFIEGARRFTEISVKKFLTTFMSESILDTSLSMNSWIFCIISIAAGVGLGWAKFVDLIDEEKITDAVFTIIFYPLFVVMFTEVFLWCLLNPAETISYSLFICFAEYPDRLKTQNQSQYETFCYHYAVSTARASNNEIPKKPDYVVYQ